MSFPSLSTPTHKIRTITRMLPCLLPPEDQLAYAKNAATIHADSTRKLEEMEAAKKSAQAEIKELDLERNRLLKIVDTGVEHRKVECDERANYSLGEMLTIRTDTGEVVDRRRLTVAESQQRMKFEEDLTEEERAAQQSFRGVDIDEDEAFANNDGHIPPHRKFDELPATTGNTLYLTAKEVTPDDVIDVDIIDDAPETPGDVFDREMGNTDDADTEIAL